MINDNLSMFQVQVRVRHARSQGLSGLWVTVIDMVLV